ncbi:excinuclease ABC subunit C [Peptoniphilus indolicus ATCC 29427]|uniref:Excinuclease ABC subunit C n=1 Tax=Peptoniphilus indolicus ATCC 29427 TaxID=997350 RepID=G4D5Z5_9FIRM|nr:excinuclease ABC subunit C [Peptoniphilus indolicus ATCC 29427]
MDDIEGRLKKLPDLPGVYIMKNAQDEIIYVGKAKNLKRG